MRRLVHARAGSRGAIALISRVAGVAPRSSCHPSNPPISTDNDHGVTHATSMSHWTASPAAAELKYRAQLSGPGVVA
ncbi:hypothetical protein A5787_18655 [Mycobacterium sp. 852002-50816_SCH5313054-b]|nr:hypothetical protein A5787_18655 [Mycobacterium sp. 852002-50816_SCH5313054-b]